MRWSARRQRRVSASSQHHLRRREGEIGWLFGGRVQRDGAASALEAVATGMPVGLLEPQESRPGVGRRDRVLAGEQQALVDSLSAKILHGWLQNRHQTLFPLTVNLRTLTAGQAAILAQWSAVAALAGRQTDAPVGSHARIEQWLAAAGANAPTLAILQSALNTPPPLHQVVQAIISNGLAAYAFVVALIATDARDPASAPFLDYVAARLTLPTTVVRSAIRRYGR